MEFALRKVFPTPRFRVERVTFPCRYSPLVQLFGGAVIVVWL
jgi:hypothetical protein